jgi:hypothetical protein
MSFETEFLEFMRDTFVRNRVTGYTAYGSPTHSTATNNYTCRLDYFHQAIDSDMKAENLVVATAWIASTGSFDPEDLITLPDGTQPKILQMDAFPDEDGPFHHIRIKFGRKG